MLETNRSIFRLDPGLPSLSGRRDDAESLVAQMPLVQALSYPALPECLGLQRDPAGELDLLIVSNSFKVCLHIL